MKLFYYVDHFFTSLFLSLFGQYNPPGLTAQNIVAEYKQELYQRVSPVVGYLTMNKKKPKPYSSYCSGVLISRNLFLTSAHCMPDGFLNNTNKDTEGFRVHFGDSLELSYRVTDILTYRLERSFDFFIYGTDYALLRLESNPGYRYGFSKIRPPTIEPSRAMFISRLYEEDKKAFFVSTKGECDSHNDEVTYDFTMDFGQSGSPLFNMKGELIGVNSNSNPVTNTSYATCAVMILEDIKKKDQSLYKEIINAKRPY